MNVSDGWLAIDVIGEDHDMDGLMLAHAGERVPKIVYRDDKPWPPQLLRGG